MTATNLNQAKLVLKHWMSWSTSTILNITASMSHAIMPFYISITTKGI